MRCVNSSVLWDLKPLETAPSAPPCPPSDAVLAYVTQDALHSLREEMAEERKRIADIKRKYGIRSLDRMLLEVQEKLIDYDKRRDKGELVPEVEVQNQQKRLEDLRWRKQELEEQIRRETSLLPTQPRVIGVARVEPAVDEQEEMYSDREIEAVGMRVAMEYEREQGRQPTDVSEQNCGYDIRSQGEDGSVRYSVIIPPPPPPPPGPRYYHLRLRVPIERYSDILRGVITPLRDQSEDLRVDLVIQADAGAQGFDTVKLDSTVRETLKQLGIAYEGRLE